MLQRKTVLLLVFALLIGGIPSLGDQPPEAENFVVPGLTADDLPLFIDLLSVASDVDGDPLGCRFTSPPSPALGTLVPGPSPCTWVYDLDLTEVQPSVELEFEIFQLADPSRAVTASLELTFTKSAPGNPTATALGPTAIRLLWFDVQDELRYEIYGGMDSGGLGPLVTLDPVVGGNVLYWDHTDLEAGEEYFYRIDVCYADGCVSSPILSAMTPALPVGQAPIAVDDEFSVAQGQRLFIPYEQLLDNDVDPQGDRITFHDWELVSLQGSNELDQVEDGFVFRSHPSTVLTGSPDVFRYRITDGQHYSDWATVELFIVPRLPAQAEPDFLQAEFGQVLEISYQDDLFANDLGVLEAVTLHFRQPQHGRLDFCCAPDRLRYVPDPGYSGPDSFWYSIRGGGESFASAEVVVDVVASSVVPATASRPDEFSLPLKPDAAGVTRAPLLFSDLLLNDQGRDLVFGFPITPGAQQAGGEITLLTPGHDPASGPAPPGYEGVVIYETDLAAIPPWASGGVVRDNFTYQVHGAGSVASTHQPELALRVVEPVLMASDPVVVHDLFAVHEGERLALGWGDLLDNDLVDRSGSSPVYSLRFGPPVHGEIAKVTSQGGMVYQAPLGFVGIDHFTYAIQNGADASSLRLGRVIVEVQDGRPIARDDAAATPQDFPVTVPVLANDEDVPTGGALTIVGVGDPVLGYTVVTANGEITYVPPPGVSGQDTFAYTVRDAVGNQASAIVTIDITGPNQPPIARDDRGVYVPGAENTYRPLANDLDPDGHPISIESFTQPEQGSLVVEGDRFFYQGPAGGLIGGRDQFTYTISDPFGGSASAIYYILQN
ncbi:MAG: Ig-like domain-containing protein [Acidobacteriota bacterium]